MKMFSGIAAGVSGYTHLGVVRGSDYVEIATVINRKGIVETKEVPKSWYEHVNNSKKALKQRKSELLNLPGVKGVGRTQSKEEYGGKSGSELTVHVSKKGVGGPLPEEVNGLSVNVKETPPMGTRACYNDENYEEIKGGTSMEFGAGTNGVMVTEGGEEYMLTAAHIFYLSDDGDCEDVEGDTYYQNSRHVGEVHKQHPEEDVVLCDNSEEPSVEFSDYIKREDDDGLGIGHYTEIGVDELMSGDYEVEQMGIHTGETKGEITDMHIEYDAEDEDDVSDCISFQGHGVKVEEVNGYISHLGDSGGPIYRDVGGGFYVISMLSIGAPDSNELNEESDTNQDFPCGVGRDTQCYSHPMYHLNNTYGYEIAFGRDRDWP